MTFETDKYLVIRNFLEEDFVKFIQDYFFIRITAGHSKKGDEQSPFSHSFYSDPLIETILDNSCESLSELTGVSLLPTYTYARLYAKGEELVCHRDRPSCEISATLALGVPEGEEISSIYFTPNEDLSDVKEIILNPGDLCLYRGCDLFHWRKPFTQRWYLQAFLHYVNADGEYKDNIYDGRLSLGREKEE